MTICLLYIWPAFTVAIKYPDHQGLISLLFGESWFTASADLSLSPWVRLLLPPIPGRPSCYPAVMSTPIAFHALAKLPQTADSLEQINIALQAEREQLESRLGIVQDARSLAESYPVDCDGNPSDEVWPRLISCLEALS